MQRTTFVLDFEFKSGKQFWTSGTDLSEEGKFFFLSTGRSIGQLNWSNNEPNNGRKPDSNETENCMAYAVTDNLKFYRLFDRFCSLKFNFVCQIVQSVSSPKRYENKIFKELWESQDYLNGNKLWWRDDWILKFTRSLTLMHAKWFTKVLSKCK